VPLSVTVTAPGFEPITVGEKVTLISQLAFEASEPVHGVVPAAATKFPDATIEVKVTGLALTFFTVTIFAVLVELTICEAKVRDAGVKVNGEVVPPVPVPVSFTSCVAKDTLLIDKTPSIVVLAVGENCTSIVHFAPAARLPEQVPPVTTE